MPGKKALNILPFWCKFLGGFFMVSGLVASFYFIYLSIKPEWLQWQVFTLYSKYLETKTLTFIKNNQGDEIAIFCYLVGFILILVSRDLKNPDLDFLCKSKAAIYSLLPVALAVLIAYFLIHGIAVIYTVALFIYLIPMIFSIIYLILRIKSNT